MTNDFEPIQHEDTLHYQFEEKRRQIAERINTAIAQNQECYIAYWVKQNPDKNLDDYTLVHGFKGEYYTFWLEHKSNWFGKYGRFEE